MKYMVMECHTSYAVVLSEDGRFLKAANLHYEIGQTVSEIVEMQEPPVEKKTSHKWRTGLATLVAACLLLMVTTLIQTNLTPYGSVYVTINPEVRIDVNRKNIVVGLDGLNADGDALIEGYSYHKKELTPVMDELVDRAIDKGYLSSGSRITLSLDAEDQGWITSTEGELSDHLNEYLADKISVTIYIGQSDDTAREIIIPVTPDAGTSSYGDSDYEETPTSEGTPEPSSQMPSGSDSPYDEPSSEAPPSETRIPESSPSDTQVPEVPPAETQTPEAPPAETQTPTSEASDDSPYDPPESSETPPVPDSPYGESPYDEPSSETPAASSPSASDDNDDESPYQEESSEPDDDNGYGSEDDEGSDGGDSGYGDDSNDDTPDSNDDDD